MFGQNKEQQWQMCFHGRCKMALFLQAESLTTDYLNLHSFAWDCYQIKPPSVTLIAPAEVWTILQLFQSSGIFSGLSHNLFYRENQLSRIFLRKSVSWLVKKFSGPVDWSVYPLCTAWCAFWLLLAWESCHHCCENTSCSTSSCLFPDIKQ